MNHPGSHRAPRRPAAAPEDGRGGDGGGGLPGAAQVLHRVVVDLSVDRVVLHRALPGLRPPGAPEDQRQPEHSEHVFEHIDTEVLRGPDRHFITNIRTYFDI